MANTNKKEGTFFGKKGSFFKGDKAHWNTPINLNKFRPRPAPVFENPPDPSKGSFFEKRGKGQKGGSSDYMHSFYANTAVGGPAAISQATLQGLGNSPMFNPLSPTATVPGGSTGIVPSGLYLGSQSGGGAVDTATLRTACNEAGISCRGQNGGYLKNKTLVKKLQEQQGGNPLVKNLLCNKLQRSVVLNQILGKGNKDLIKCTKMVASRVCDHMDKKAPKKAQKKQKQE